jgi:bifunctional DNase/RNase
MIEMSVESVRINLATQQRVVILKALDQDRYLFLWIAHPEAYAIAVQLQGTISPRPLTHDLIKNLLEKVGAKVVRVVISDLVEEIYYSAIILDVAGEEMEVDARPSDAIALAVRTNTPVFVAEQVLEKGGVYVNPEEKVPTSPLETKEVEQEQPATDTDSETAEKGESDLGTAL